MKEKSQHANRRYTEFNHTLPEDRRTFAAMPESVRQVITDDYMKNGPSTFEMAKKYRWATGAIKMLMDSIFAERKIRKQEQNG